MLQVFHAHERTKFKEQKRGVEAAVSPVPLGWTPPPPLTLTVKKMEAGSRAGWAYSSLATTLPPLPTLPYAQRLTSR